MMMAAFFFLLKPAGGDTPVPRILPRGSSESPAPPPPAGPNPLAVPWTGGFELRDGDVVAFTGGTDASQQESVGTLETLLSLQAREVSVSFYSLAWQGDTVHRQPRPVGFAPVTQDLKRIGASVVIASFGQMEVLDGAGGLPSFLKAYEALLDQYAAVTPRIVLVTPHLFEKKPGRPLLPDLSVHNDDLALYTQGILDLARRRGFLTVDLSAFRGSGSLTTDGVNLSPLGQAEIAWETTRQLTGASPVSLTDFTEAGGFASDRREKVRRVILEKSRLWHQHWRPTNWAFAYGDRMEQPSSKDHRPGFPRWLPLEIDAILPLIAGKEKDIHLLVRETQP
jgi:hypothetical protein